jgi:hypothetical protein
MKYLLRFRIKCVRFENIYNYNTHSNSSDWLKTFKRKKDRRFFDSDKCFFLITLLGTSGSLIPTYEKLGIGVFRCFLTLLCITHRVPTSPIYKSNNGDVCLSVWTKIGYCLEDSSNHYLFLVVSKRDRGVYLSVCPKVPFRSQEMKGLFV